ncbi:hypothetical protein PQ465_01855 [Sphingobacterium oryzagri]|uniref:UDP-N-acetylglucosamine kinase n=1 Tax=Sphingobacterium oryzagri TaxID=3025669 RepID=A0ABY7WHQ6_9SPHI|nr:hypothetical protein [Sphingobacterium sp. KACC 22765]WDF69136.1 hypothetical protein PQ465_01855 [Sphingobacterium sp. KACC 22765]
MARIKRLRVFAGPNGSGKSTLFHVINEQFQTGPFVNADIIESHLSATGYVNLADFGLQLSQRDLDSFFQQPASLSLLEKSRKAGHEITILIKNNIIVDRGRKTHSYEASLITAFIRSHLMKKGVSYAFESVMSHPSKLEEIKHAKELAYKTYLYFVCLDDPLLNISRVSNRVEKGGHAVPDEKIIQRYDRVLDLLLSAVGICEKSFLFDNSSAAGMTLIAQLDKGQLTIMVDEDKLPNWFISSIINRIDY